MIVKLTRAQIKQLKPYFEALQAQPINKPYGMLVAQISDKLPQMRVGFIPGELSKRFLGAARELPRTLSDEVEHNSDKTA